MNLTGHMLVKNEQNWIWYAIQSVLPHLSKLIIFDTGSTDDTVPIIHTINSKKIQFHSRPIKSRSDIVTARQEMHQLTRTNWYLLVDGDEVWPTKSINKLKHALNSAPTQTIGAVVRTRNCVGDIFHYQPESAGHYQLKGRTGHLTIRAYKKSTDYSWTGEYPLEGYTHKSGKLLNQQDSRLIFVDTYYYHLTHLKRTTDEQASSVIDRIKKFKLEIGIPADRTQIPEVFFRSRPDIVPDPHVTYTPTQKLLAHILTPIKHLKRKINKS